LTLPEYVIQDILKKFGPKIKAYLEAVGFFDVEGTYGPMDLIQPGPMQKYVLASKAKNKAVWEFLEGTLLKEMELSSAEFASAYGLTEVWNVGDIAEKYFRPRVGTAIKLMTSTDKKLLTNFIFSNSGMNERPLARAILKQPSLSSIVDNSGFRARRIIRTERHRMTWGSSLEFAKGAGSQTKEWRTVGDSRTRPVHRALNGEIVGIQEAFSNGLQYPSEPNCRCHLVYGFEKGLRRTGIQAFTKTPTPYTGLSEDDLSELYS
jgi:SPP1 gp7 family putative phage head morphogenesis protein